MIEKIQFKIIHFINHFTKSEKREVVDKIENSVPEAGHNSLGCMEGKEHLKHQSMGLKYRKKQLKVRLIETLLYVLMNWNKEKPLKMT